MASAPMLHYHVGYDRRLDASPIGEVGLYYAALGSIVLLVHFLIRNSVKGTEILMVLGVLFWAAGAVVSLIGVFRLAGRRSAMIGLVVSIAGAIIYAACFA